MKYIANFHKFGYKSNCFSIARTDFIFGYRMSTICSTRFNTRDIYIWITGKNIDTTYKIPILFCKQNLLPRLRFLQSIRNSHRNLAAVSGGRVENDLAANSFCAALDVF